MEIKHGPCVPFPTKPGLYTRFVMADSPQKKGAITIAFGQVMLFEGEKVTILDHQAQVTTAEMVMKGDIACQKSDCMVTYEPIIGVGLQKKQQDIRKSRLDTLGNEPL